VDKAQEFVLAFVFGLGVEADAHVMLIKKNRPEWQNGKLNGIGGHIEEGETPSDAMEREWAEETMLPQPSEWRKVCVMEGSGWRVFIFAGRTNTFTLEETDGMEVDEGKLTLVPLDEWEDYKAKTIPNLNWLIPKALTVLEHDAGITGDLVDTERPF